MSSASHSRTARFTRRSTCYFFALAISCPPNVLLARPPQSSGAPPAPQQPAPDAAKKDPAVAAPDSAAKPQSTLVKRHRIFTNDDISTGPTVPIAPGARRRLKQLNRCDRACFREVEKQALSWGYTTAFPRSTRQEMEDRLAADIEELRNDPKWQQLLLNMISADLNRCTQLQNAAGTPEESPSHTPTRQEILDEEERARNYRQTPGTDVNAAGSAVLAYRFSTRPDPLRASFMVYQYMDELHQTCQVQDPPDDPADEDP